MQGVLANTKSIYSYNAFRLSVQGSTLDVVQFDQNVASFSVAVCTFVARAETEWYVVVGTAKDMTLSPRTCSGGALVLFKLNPEGSKLEHVHTVCFVVSYFACTRVLARKQQNHS